MISFQYLLSSFSSFPHCFSFSGSTLVTCRAEKIKGDESLNFLVNKKPFCFSLGDRKFSQEGWSSSERSSKPTLLPPLGQQGPAGMCRWGQTLDPGKGMMDQADKTEPRASPGTPAFTSNAVALH